MVQKSDGIRQELEREQKGRGEAEIEGGKRRKKGTMTKSATTIDVAEEAVIASVGDNQACSDGRSEENECSSSKGIGRRSRAEYGDAS